jgi:hypothetical protein
MAPDAYMGFLPRDELVARLNVLVEAERAGARVAAESARSAVGDRRRLLAEIAQDEARWCAALSAQVRDLGGEPSRAVGAFHGKALAIADLDARMAFLNRGQAWVVRELERLLPQVRDDGLHRMLAAMREQHVVNIARAGASAP